ncbi:MAG: hypothetical protein COX43_02805 [Parcubacteria group bacterium CG23_combo_of_CG06-09_8_20_14_all_35_9]|nr:MAG: hypothetical protein COX43_02805 [Parcubacteria group bacterium CG23_combo_of_CG06-09_8_20_14_all_35_9]
MATRKRNIKGHTVIYEDDAKYGADYLSYDLDYEEAEIFFRHARMHGSAKFEDDDDRNYTLKRNSDGTYTLSRRKSGGWF